jgi:hypothetical protein
MVRSVRLSAGLLALTVACAISAAAVAAPSMTKDDAVAIARTINLTGDDMPGYSSSRSTPSTGDGRFGKRFDRCAGTVPTSKAVADVQSNDFERSSQGSFDAVSSDVLVLPNAALARKDLRAAATKRARKCLAAAFTGQKAAGGVTILSAKVTSLPAPAANGVAIRIKMRVATQGVTFPMYTDFFIVGRGPVEAATGFTSGPSPPLRAEEKRVVGIVKTRLDQANFTPTVL